MAANEVLPAVADLDAVLADLARVLRPGGRLVAADRVGALPRADCSAPHDFAFSAENGVAALEPHFARVERRDVVGDVVFPTRDALRGFLARHRRSAELDVERLPEPFQATVRTAVLVAEKSA